jgi:hypothetical protein
MEHTHPWHLWPGRHWPLLAAEERRFADDLQHRAAGRTAAYDRGALTAVLNAMRCGMTVDALLDAGPGLQPAVLLAAYRHAEKLRATAAGAWQRILDNPSISVWVTNQHLAYPLMTTQVQQLNRAAAESTPKAFTAAVIAVRTETEDLCVRATRVEQRLAALQAPSPAGVELGRLLYDPYDPQLWGQPAFVPDRVGALMPMRVRDLLGEPRR